MRKTYGKVLPGMKLSDLSGKLIVVEGTDCAGRTTQINLLKTWLEEQGHAVLDTGMTRSPLAGEGIRRAKEGNNLGRVTQSLFYATDFVDRLENEIVPALRAGFVVLTDRYIYSLMARAVVRGMDAAWIRSIYSMALVPDAVIYLRIGLDALIPRVIFSRGFDYWESGMDVFPGQDMYESFRSYQTALLAEFDRLGAEYHFETVDASAGIKTVFAELQKKVLRILEGDSRREFISQRYDHMAESSPTKAAEILAAVPREVARKDLEALLSSAAAYASNGNGRNVA